MCMRNSGENRDSARVTRDLCQCTTKEGPKNFNPIPRTALPLQTAIGQLFNVVGQIQLISARYARLVHFLLYHSIWS